MNIRFEDILKKEAYLHLLFWCLYITFPLLKFTEGPFILAQWLTSNSNILLIVIYAYTCYFYLFPLQNKRKFIIIVVFTLLMTVFGTLFSEFIIRIIIYQLDNYSFWIHSLGIIGEYFFIGIVFLTFYSIKRNHQLDKEKKITEINSLKSQINPHFLLNTLNSIYAYSLEGNQKTSELILKLSDNFKYVLYKGKKNKVSMVDDLEHIKDFIEINRLRWGDKIDIILTYQIDNKELEIAPLLLITFVENAVKYTSKLKGAHHKIEIDYLLKNNVLTFSCKNAFDTTYKLSKEWKESGIGLTNTKKRLDLIYSDCYQLNITDIDYVFNVHLTLKL